MRVEQKSAVRPEMPTAGISGTLLSYNVITTGHDGRGNNDSSGFAPGCFDDFLQAGEFYIPILMEHDANKIVGFVNEIVSYENGVRIFGSVFDVRVFDMNYMGLSVGTICAEVRNGIVLKAKIHEVSLTENPADWSGKVDKKAY